MRDAFQEVVRAQADKERRINEAEAYQNDIVPRARGERQRLIASAAAGGRLEAGGTGPARFALGLRYLFRDFSNQALYIAGGFDVASHLDAENQLLIGGDTGLRGYPLRDEDGNIYRIPAALPSAPAGARVVVIFDGQGSSANDLDFGDGVATLHSPPGMVNILEDNGDQVALYNTCLLYTSPSPRDRTRSRIPSSA